MKNLKHKIIVPLMLILLSSCAKDELATGGSEAAKDNANLVISLSLPEDAFDTGVGFEPMTKANDTYKIGLRDVSRYMFLKKVEENWIVEKMIDHNIISTPNKYTTIPAVGMPANELRVELRPGLYRLVAVVNPNGAVWNTTIKEGVIIGDDTDPDFKAPYLMKYVPQLYPEERIDVFLGDEIFIARHEFTIEKQENLNPAEVAPLKLNLDAKRCVSRLRILLKDNGKNFIDGQANYETDFIMQTDAYFKAEEGKSFCVGFDVWGKAYYNDDEPFYTLHKRSNNTGRYVIAEDGSGIGYRICSSGNGNRSFNAYFFTDPEDEDGYTYYLTHMNVTGRSNGGSNHWFYGNIPLKMLVNHYDALSFEVDPTTFEEAAYRSYVFQEEDSSGNIVDVNNRFSPYMEWNYSFN